MKNGGFTKRSKVVKLELTGETFDKLSKVAGTLYDINLPQSSIEAADSTYWTAIDTLLFNSAKESYEQILRLFDERPRVFKLESCKEKVWALNSEQYLDLETSDACIPESNGGEPAVKDAYLIESELDSYINPFAIVSTNQVATSGLTSNLEVWAEKLHKLQKLTPREDLAGYEYKESMIERRNRILKQRRYNKLLELEIERRENRPTPIEEIEDALFYLVDTICKQDERLQKVLRRRERRQIQKVWHPATSACRLRPLQALEGDKVMISDLEIQCETITISGVSLPRFRPWDLLMRHELERYIVRAMSARRKEVEELAYKNANFTTKIAQTISSLRKDPKSLARKMIDQFIFNQRSGQMEKSEPTTNDSDFNLLRSMQAKDVVGGDEFDLTGISLEDFVKRRFANIEMKDKPVDPPDCVRLKMLFLGDLPTPYTLRINKIRPFRRGLRSPLGGDESNEARQESATALLTTESPSNLSNKLNRSTFFLAHKDAPNKPTDTNNADKTVDLRRKIARKYFNVTLTPDDLVVESNLGKDGGKEGDVEVVFDRNDRVEFEQKLLAEIAAAGPIPVQHLQIEEIRRLPMDSPELIALKEKRDKLLTVYLHKMDSLAKDEKKKGWFNRLREEAENVKDSIEVIGNRENSNGAEKVKRNVTFLIPNPADVLKDPKHWMAESMKRPSEEKRRQLRLRKLQTSMLTFQLSERERYVQQRLLALRQLRQETLEDALEQIVYPFLREVFNPAATLMKPYAVKLLEKIDRYATLIAEDPRVINAVRVLKEYVSSIKKGSIDRATEAVLASHTAFLAEVVRHLKMTASAITDLVPSESDLKELQEIINFICRAVEERSINFEIKSEVASVLQQLCEVLISKFEERLEIDAPLTEDIVSADKTEKSVESETQEDFLIAIEELKKANEITFGENYSPEEVANGSKKIVIGAKNGIAPTDAAAADDDASESDGEEGDDDESDNIESISEKLRSTASELENFRDEEQSLMSELLSVGEQQQQLAVSSENTDQEVNVNIDRLDIEELMEQIISSVELNDHDFNQELFRTPRESVDAIDLTPALDAAVRTSSDSSSNSRDSNTMGTIYDGYTKRYLARRVFGYEITVNVLITQSLRNKLKIEHLCAEDIALHLENQLFDFNSVLHAGHISRDCVAISHTSPFKRRFFDQWEQFWVHSVHPSFFGYSAIDTKPKQHRSHSAITNGGEAVGTELSAAVDVSEEAKLEMKAKQIGLHFTTPIERFSTRNRETFDALRHDLPEGEDDEKDGNTAARRKQRRLARADTEELNGDDGHKKPKMFRPNLANVTEKDIERLARLYRAFKRDYESEMQSGLIDGIGMKPVQYEALKNRDTAFRLLRVAKTRFNFMHRDDVDPFHLPDFKPTNIDMETFNSWVEEVNREAQERLHILRAEKEKMKEAMQQEARQRKKLSQQRQWVIQKFIECCGEDAILVSTGLYERLAQLDEARGNLGGGEGISAEIKADIIYIAHLKKTMVAESRRTRKLFEHIRQWVKATAKLNAPSSSKIASMKNSGSKKRIFSAKSTRSVMSTKSSKSDKFGANSSTKGAARQVLLEIAGQEEDEEEQGLQFLVSPSRVGRTSVRLTQQRATSFLAGIQEDFDSILSPAEHTDSSLNSIRSEALSIAAAVNKFRSATSTRASQSQPQAEGNEDAQLPPVRRRSVSFSEPNNSFHDPTSLHESFHKVQSESLKLSSARNDESMMDPGEVGQSTKLGANSSFNFNAGNSTSPKFSDLMFIDTSATEIDDRTESEYGASEAGEDVAEAHTLPKADVFHYLDSCLAWERANTKEERRKKKAEEKKAKEEAKERRLQSIQKFQKHGKVSQHSLHQLSGSDSDDSGSEEEDTDEHSVALLSTPSRPSPNKGQWNLLPFSARSTNPAGTDSARVEEEQQRPASAATRPRTGYAESDQSSPVSKFSQQQSQKQEKKWHPIGKADADFLASLKWVSCMKKNKQFFSCLRELPTEDPSVFSKDELGQFASIMAEIGPIASQILDSISEKREDARHMLIMKREGAQGAGKNVKSLTKQQIRKQMRKREKKIAAAKQASKEQAQEQGGEGIEQEGEMDRRRAEQQRQHLLAVKLQAEKERAAAMAHTHRYIQGRKKSAIEQMLLRLNRHGLSNGEKGVDDDNNEGQDPFCYVCRENVHKLWHRQNEVMEGEWRKEVEDQVAVHIEDIADAVRNQTEEQHKLQFTAEAEAKIREEDLASAKNSSADSFASITDTPDSRSVDRSKSSIGGGDHDNRKGKEKKVIRETAHDRAWKKQLAAAKELLARAGLPSCDPRGVSTLPSEPARVDEVRVNKPVLLPDESASDESCGLKVRLWHRDQYQLQGASGAQGLRSNFLGLATLTEKDVLNAAKGMRTFRLTPDPFVKEAGSKPFPISGTLTLRLRLFQSLSRGVAGQTARWRLLLVKFSGVTAVDEKEKSNVYCEVYWKGPALSQGQGGMKVTHTLTWVSVGCTRVKAHTTQGSFSKDFDDALFELPPVWTTLTLPAGREYDLRDRTVGGGWVPRNSPLLTRQEEDDDDLSDEEDNVKGKKGKNRASNGKEKASIGNASTASIATSVKESGQTEEEIRQFRLAIKVTDMLQQETQKRLEVVRLTLGCQERERRCMNEEEVRQRETAMRQLQHKYSALIREQELLCRRFMSLQQQSSMSAPLPPVLTRVRYMMGEELQGGGLRVQCQDPTDGCLLHVVTLPILHKADEASFEAEARRMVGKPSDNLVRVRDFFFFHSKDFNSSGFSSVDGRTAVIVAEFHQGPSLLRYISDRWDDISNDQFRDLLAQVALALAQLHEEGIVHRNLSPSLAVTVQLLDSGQGNKKHRAVSLQPLCKLGDYFLLHNPRQPGCQMSQGRADWGCTLTAPPEAKGGVRSAVSSKSDIYSFGVCIFHWATRGRLPLPDFSNNFAISNRWSEEHLDRVRALIPLKWEKWLHAALSMCLQPKPEGRATARDIYTYLTSRFGKK